MAHPDENDTQEIIASTTESQDSSEPLTTKEILNRDHGYLSGTQDGLSVEDRVRGYHYYKSYKVYHECQKCHARREVVAYHRGWSNTDLCNQCVMKESVMVTQPRLMEKFPPEGILQEWVDALKKNDMEFGQAMYYTKDFPGSMILGYDKKNDELWVARYMENSFGILQEWVDALKKNDMEGQAMYYTKDFPGFMILGYDEKNDELWVARYMENSFGKIQNYSKVRGDFKSY